MGRKSSTRTAKAVGLAACNLQKCKAQAIYIVLQLLLLWLSGHGRVQRNTSIPQYSGVHLNTVRSVQYRPLYRYQGTGTCYAQTYWCSDISCSSSEIFRRICETSPSISRYLPMTCCSLRGTCSVPLLSSITAGDYAVQRHSWTQQHQSSGYSCHSAGLSAIAMYGTEFTCTHPYDIIKLKSVFFVVFHNSCTDFIRIVGILMDTRALKPYLPQSKITLFALGFISLRYSHLLQPRIVA